MVAVTGVVLDIKGIPIGNALVALNTEWDNTDALGEFRLSAQPGRYMLKIMRKKYKIHKEVIYIERDIDLEITLRRE